MQSSKQLVTLPHASPELSLQLSTRKPTHTLVIVDPSVEDSVALMQAINEEAEVIVLDSRRNGVEQITELLAQRCQIQHLQLIALGCPGRLQLGTIWLDQSLLDRYRSEIQSWQQAFRPEATLLLYDCTIALGVEGMEFVGQLSQMIGTLVSVSCSPYLNEW